MSSNEQDEKQYEEIIIKLVLSNDYLRKLDKLIELGIVRSRPEAFRRSLELSFDKYANMLGDSK
jgi:Arc/MetJ-type ribon-helix-helix transcriptional regulator